MREIIVTVKRTDRILKCPKCENNIKFKAKANQVAEDLCNVWVECICGFDPTLENTNYRYEDVWGEMSKDTINLALDCWNDGIRDKIWE